MKAGDPQVDLGAEQLAAASHGVEPLLRTDEASALLRLSTQRLARMRLDGSGPDFIKAGRTVLYRPADVKAWLQKRVCRSTSDIAA